MNGPTGKYYYNEHTLETTWTPPGSSVPDTPLPMPLPPAPQGNGASGPALPPPRVSVHGNRKSLGGRYSARYGAHAHPIMPQSNNPAAYTYGAGSVGNEGYNQAFNDPRYQQMTDIRMAPLINAGLGFHVELNHEANHAAPPPPPGAPPPMEHAAPQQGGGGGGGGGGKGGGDKGGGGGDKGGGGGGRDKKKKVDLWRHRLRAMPFLARNMGMVSGGTNVLIGLTIAMNPPYSGGIEPVPMSTFDAATGTLTPRTIQLNSTFGGLMASICLVGGLIVMSFEYWTYGQKKVRVDRVLWKLRVLLYGLLAVPGYFAFIFDGLMPVMLPSIFCTFTTLANIGACLTELPSEKDWKWPICSKSTEAKKKEEEQGGQAVGLFDKLNCKEMFEQGHLPRFMFLLSYALINIIVGLHAYFRHGYSEKGKALRGEPFLGCPVTDSSGIKPLPVCMFEVPCSGPFLCPSIDGGAGVAPIMVPAADPPLLQTFWIGFGWLGFPTAKAMGQLLNLNCAILTMPVTHSMIKNMHDLTSIYGPQWMHFVAFVIPFDKAVVFHKACAKYFILPCVFVHATLHYFNYGRAPYYNAIFGNTYPATPQEAGWGLTYGAYGLSGQLIVIAMFIIYCGAHEKVKRSHYETFWNSHHFFILFFGALLFHGSVFWIWALWSLFPYAIDRILIRVIWRGNKPFGLAQVFFWREKGKALPDVVTLQFENAMSDKGHKTMNYMEGHYLYLNCPHIEGNNRLLKQWHPFTISSAPDEPVLEVNIRINPSEHSWTNKMARYLMIYDPVLTTEKKEDLMSSHIEFHSRNPTTGGLAIGKVKGADGKHFFYVDGPHGAPSQHVFSYDTAMLVGAGIGVTPCSSIMRGIVEYRWKKSYTPKNLYFFWVARLTDLCYFGWLLRLLPELKAKERVHNEYYAHDMVAVEGIRRRISELVEAIKKGGAGPAPPPTLPVGWIESRTPTGEVYYFNEQTNQTSWTPPHGTRTEAPQDPREELVYRQGQLKEASDHQRRLECTIYLTGVKKEQLKVKEGAKPDSPDDLVNKLLEAKDPQTGEPYVKLKAGRPDWPGEFQSVKDFHGRENIGVVFCGAPMIAEALKKQCEKLSDKKSTIFRLHKENF